MKPLSPLKFENRKSTGYLFVHAFINDGNCIKHLDVYWEKKTGMYGLEVYQGKNYVVGCTERSYSRHYPKLKGMPAKYKPLVSQMMKRLKKGVRK